MLEIGGQTFLTPQSLKQDISNMNLTNKLIRKCKKLDVEQKKKYIELGKVCQECLFEDDVISTNDEICDNGEICENDKNSDNDD